MKTCNSTFDFYQLSLREYCDYESWVTAKRRWNDGEKNNALAVWTLFSRPASGSFGKSDRLMKHHTCDIFEFPFLLSLDCSYIDKFLAISTPRNIVSFLASYRFKYFNTLKKTKHFGKPPFSKTSFYVENQEVVVSFISTAAVTPAHLPT